MLDVKNHAVRYKVCLLIIPPATKPEGKIALSVTVWTQSALSNIDDMNSSLLLMLWNRYHGLRTFKNPESYKQQLKLSKAVSKKIFMWTILSRQKKSHLNFCYL